MFKAYYNLLLCMYLKAIMWKQQLYGFYPIVLNRPQLLSFLAYDITAVVVVCCYALTPVKIEKYVCTSKN